MVEAACSLTALRSRTKAFSVLEPAAGELIRRRCRAERTAGDRSWEANRGAARMIWPWGSILLGSVRAWVAFGRSGEV